MKSMENKWKKMKLLQRCCMILAILCWTILLLPLLMDMAGAVRIRAYLSQHAWLLPLFGLLAITLTAADFMIGYRVYAHENKEKHPIVHHKRRKKR